MKRAFPLLVVALLGAVGLPVVMLACAKTTEIYLSLSATPTYMIRVDEGLWYLFRVVDGHPTPAGWAALLSGAALAMSSIALREGGRAFWPRAASVFGSVGVLVYFVGGMANRYEQTRGVPLSPKAVWDYALAEVIFCSPPILWALAVFFFALVARPRKAPSTRP